MIKLFIGGIVLTLAAVFTLWALPHVMELAHQVKLPETFTRKHFYIVSLAIGGLFVLYEEGTKHE